MFHIFSPTLPVCLISSRNFGPIHRVCVRFSGDMVKFMSATVQFSRCTMEEKPLRTARAASASFPIFASATAETFPGAFMTPAIQSHLWVWEKGHEVHICLIYFPKSGFSSNARARFVICEIFRLQKVSTYRSKSDDCNFSRILHTFFDDEVWSRHRRVYLWQIVGLVKGNISKTVFAVANFASTVFVGTNLNVTQMLFVVLPREWPLLCKP